MGCRPAKCSKKNTCRDSINSFDTELETNHYDIYGEKTGIQNITEPKPEQIYDQVPIETSQNLPVYDNVGYESEVDLSDTRTRKPDKSEIEKVHQPVMSELQKALQVKIKSK